MVRHTIELDSNELTYILGYLEPKHWADALIQEPEYREIYETLIKQQERAFCFDLMPDVLELVEENK